MTIAILVNDVPARVIIQTVPEQFAKAIRNGSLEAEEVADTICTVLDVACEEWLIAEDNEFVLQDMRVNN